MTQTEKTINLCLTVIKVWNRFYSLRDLAKKTKVSSATLNRFINGGNIDVKTLILLEKYVTRKPQ